jgi:hypothetical protein
MERYARQGLRMVAAAFKPANGEQADPRRSEQG